MEFANLERPELGVDIPFSQFARIVDCLTVYVNEQGVKLSSNRPIPTSFWMVLFGLDRALHQKYYRGVDTRSGGIIAPAVAKSIYWISLLSSSKLISEVKRHIPIYETMLQQEVERNNQRQKEYVQMAPVAAKAIHDYGGFVTAEVLGTLIDFPPRRLNGLLKKVASLQKYDAEVQKKPYAVKVNRL